MTNWLPDLSTGSGPLYLRLADQLERDIQAGALAGGSKLPPQRNLAYDVGVTIGTVGRAYALLRERGLVSGEVGRGTYVLPAPRPDASGAETAALPASIAGTRASADAGKLGMDTTAAPEVGQAGVIGRIAASIVAEHPGDVTGYVRRTPPDWLEAGRRWLASGGWAPEPADIVPTLGGHAAILAVIAAATAPGDRVAFEQLTYSQVARSAELIGRRSVGVEMDAHGMDPEDFERVCAQRHPKLVFLMPGLHNPTLTVTPEARRRDIVAIARRHNVLIVEDAIYATLLGGDMEPLAALAPERVFHVGGLSKAVSAGVRGGWVSCPPHFAPRVLSAYRMLTGGKPFLISELTARLVLSGAAGDVCGRVKAEIAARETAARAAFDGCDFTSHPSVPFLWMKLPEPWLPATFKQAAANEGILIDDEDEFKCARTDRSYHRVRIAFAVPTSRTDVTDGFARLRLLLDSGIAGYDRYG